MGETAKASTASDSNWRARRSREAVEAWRTRGAQGGSGSPEVHSGRWHRSNGRLAHAKVGRRLAACGIGGGLRASSRTRRQRELERTPGDAEADGSPGGVRPRRGDMRPRGRSTTRRRRKPNGRSLGHPSSPTGVDAQQPMKGEKHKDARRHARAAG